MFCPAVAVCGSLEVPASHRNHFQRRLSLRAKATRTNSDESGTIWPPEDYLAAQNAQQDALISWMKMEVLPTLHGLDEKLERMMSSMALTGSADFMSAASRQPKLVVGEVPAKESSWRRRTQQTDGNNANRDANAKDNELVPLPPGESLDGMPDGCNLEAFSRNTQQDASRPSSRPTSARGNGFQSVRTSQTAANKGLNRVLGMSRTSFSIDQEAQNTGSGRRSSSMPRASTNNSLHTLEAAKETHTMRVKVWNFLENPDAPEALALTRWYHNSLSVFTVLSVVAALSLSVEPSMTSLNIMQVVIEAIFLVEFLVRFVFCPRKLVFFVEWHNILDMLAIAPLCLRAVVDFKIPNGSDDIEDLERSVLLGVVPVLRLLKLIKRFERFRLLVAAVDLYIEALPTCLFSLLMLTLIFSAGIFIVEPRDNIPSLPIAIWLTVVTMTTVGYGDITPQSTAGSSIATIMVITSCLYMAMPLGIIGQAFTTVWESRDQLILRGRTKDLLRKWAYKAADIPVLFKHFDKDGDGTLTQEEFLQMIKEMRIGLSEPRALELFNNFDLDCSGLLEGAEFVKAIFPERYKEMYEVCWQADGSCSHTLKAYASPKGSPRSLGLR